MAKVWGLPKICLEVCKKKLALELSCLSRVVKTMYEMYVDTQTKFISSHTNRCKHEKQVHCDNICTVHQCMMTLLLGYHDNFKKLP